MKRLVMAGFGITVGLTTLTGCSSNETPHTMPAQVSTSFTPTTSSKPPVTSSSTSRPSVTTKVVPASNTCMTLDTNIPNTDFTINSGTAKTDKGVTTITLTLMKPFDREAFDKMMKDGKFTHWGVHVTSDNNTVTFENNVDGTDLKTTYDPPLKNKKGTVTEFKQGDDIKVSFPSDSIGFDKTNWSAALYVRATQQEFSSICAIVNPLD